MNTYTHIPELDPDYIDAGASIYPDPEEKTHNCPFCDSPKSMTLTEILSNYWCDRCSGLNDFIW